MHWFLGTPGVCVSIQPELSGNKYTDNSFYSSSGSVAGPPRAFTTAAARFFNLRFVARCCAHGTNSSISGAPPMSADGNLSIQQESTTSADNPTRYSPRVYASRLLSRFRNRGEPEKNNSSIQTTTGSQFSPVPMSSMSTGTNTALRPMQFENFFNEYESVTGIDSFEGIRFDLQQPMSRNFTMTGNLALGAGTHPTEKCTIHIGPVYSNDESKTTMLARFGLDGSVNARLAQQLSDNIDIKVQGGAQLAGKGDMLGPAELAVNYVGADWTGSLKAIWQSTLILGTSFSQALTSKLQLGCDLLWIKANQASIGSLGGRYQIEDNVFAGQVTMQPDFKSNYGLLRSLYSFRFNHSRKISERFALGSSVQFSLPDNEAVVQAGYEHTFRQARFTGLLDSHGRVSGFLQDFSGLGVSGMIDFPRQDYRFGLSMSMLPKP